VKTSVIGLICIERVGLTAWEATNALVSQERNCTLLSQNATKRCSENLAGDEEGSKRIQLQESHKLSKDSHYATDLDTISLLHMVSSHEDDARELQASTSMMLKKISYNMCDWEICK